MSAYTKVNVDWKDFPDTTTPVTAAGLEQIEQGIADAHTEHVEKTIVDAKGDLIVASAADTVARQAVGTNDDVLAADSAQANGVVWKKINNAMVASAAAIEQSKIAFNDWTDYIPVLTGSTGNPTLGTGAIQVGKYFQIGKFVYGRAKVKAGTADFVNGSGVVEISLPVAADEEDENESLGAGYVFDASATVFWFGVVELNATGDKCFMRPTNETSSATQLSFTNLFTWAASDELSIHFAYKSL